MRTFWKTASRKHTRTRGSEEEIDAIIQQQWAEEYAVPYGHARYLAEEVVLRHSLDLEEARKRITELVSR